MLLVKSGYKAGDVVSFKVTTGEEIIAEFKRNEDKGFVVTRPYVLLPSQRGFGMMPWVLSAQANKDEILIKDIHIMVDVPSDESIATEYKQVTTGIQIAPSGIL